MRSWMLLSAALLIAGSAHGQPSDAAARGAEACAADYQRLCAGVAHDRDQMIACIRQRAAELSDACKAAMAAANAAHQGQSPPAPPPPR